MKTSALRAWLRRERVREFVAWLEERAQPAPNDITPTSVREASLRVLLDGDVLFRDPYFRPAEGSNDGRMLMPDPRHPIEQLAAAGGSEPLYPWLARMPHLFGKSN